jgi:8-oxo-dGTP pyrophosphatase MutT (NUDIX family)
MPHIHEKIDFTVEVFIVYGGKVLLRKHDKYKMWLSVGGHIELDEDPNQAAIREVKEEVGLDIELYDPRPFDASDADVSDLIPPISLNRHRISDTHEHIALIYFARASSDKVVPDAVNEVSEGWKWCAKDEIEKLDPIKRNVILYAKRALDEVK